MLSIFRRGIVSKLMLVVLAIGIFAIVITGFGTGGTGGLGGLGGGGSIGSAGGEKLTSREVQQQVQRQLSQARQNNPELGVAQLLDTGAFEDIVRQLFTTKALLSFADAVGFGVSKQQVDREIASIPAFQNMAGQFDNNTFRQALAQQNVTEDELRDDIRASLLQQQMLAPVAAGVKIPEAAALQYASLLLERRSGTVGLVPTQSFAAGINPSDAEIATFHRQNGSRYMVPERRVIRYAMIGAEQLGNAAQPTDAEIAAFYRANAATYAGSETRSLSQVVLPSREAAQTFAAKLARGTSFDQAAAEAGFGKADTAVANQTRAQFVNLTSEAVANAVFSAAQGAVTQPIQSDFGWHVVRVDSIARTEARPIAAVRDEIAAQLAAQKRQEGLADLVTKIEDSIAEGSTLDEVAREHRLTVAETPAVTAAGTGDAGPLQPELQPLLKSGFDLTQDDDPVVETIGNGERYALIGVSRIIPAAPAPLAQIRDRVRADLIARRADERARQVAAAILAKINGGTATAQAFAGAGAALPPVQSISARRMEIAQGGQVPPPLAMMFSMKKGTAKLLQAPDGQGWFVVHLAETEAGNAAGQAQLIAMTRQQIARDTANEYAEQFVKAVEKQQGVKRNEEAIAALKQQIRSGAAVQ